jgi:subtilisin-like proprotein convertase family protein/BMFP domain-containing protein YqiC/DNA-directed RNA polymerase subunit RPC12/RpoP/translation initiation factor IF-1
VLRTWARQISRDTKEGDFMVETFKIPQKFLLAGFAMLVCFALLVNVVNIPEHSEDRKNSGKLMQNDKPVTSSVATYWNNATVYIPDNAANGTPLNVSLGDSHVITDVNVYVGIDHPDISTISVTLYAPGGGVGIVLKQASTGSGANLYTWYDNESTPYQSLTSLNGRTPRGTWGLSVFDNKLDSKTGAIKKFWLSFTYSDTLYQNDTSTYVPPYGTIYEPIIVPSEAWGNIAEVNVGVKIIGSAPSSNLYVSLIRTDLMYGGTTTAILHYYSGSGYGIDTWYDNQTYPYDPLTWFNWYNATAKWELYVYNRDPTYSCTIERFTLSFNRRPILDSFSVAPSNTGYSNSIYNFTVRYTDRENDAPINVTTYWGYYLPPDYRYVEEIRTMSKVDPSDNNYVDGVDYYYSTTGSTFGVVNDRYTSAKTAFDNNGVTEYEYGYGYAYITVLNAPPQITGASITPTSPKVSDVLTATSIGWSDPENDPPNYYYKWYKNNVLIGGATGNTLSGSGVFVRNDTINVEITPNDGTNNGTSVNSSVVTIQNSAPSITGASITPTTIYANTYLNATATGWADADGDVASYKYKWYRNGAAISGQTSSMLSPGYLVKGQTVYVEITPYDGIGDGNPVSSQQIVVSDSPPTTPVVNVTPDSPYTSDNIVATITTPSVDADTGDTVWYRYKWYRNTGGGFELQESETTFGQATSDTVSESKTSKGEYWQCIVYASDQSETLKSSTASDTVQILNTPPSITSVSITPSPANASSTLTAVPAGWSDADNDTQSYYYQWYKNGSAISGATAKTLSSGNFVKGDNISVTVTPNDGIINGTSKSSGNTTIQNNPPTTPTISVTPKSPNINDNLNCTITTPSTDIDNDPITYTYKWYKNGELQSSLTLVTVSTTYQINGPFGSTEMWACHVTANDTSSDSGTATDQVKIGNLAPTNATISIAPSAPTTTDNITINVTTPSTDPDGGGAVSYVFKWYKKVGSDFVVEYSNTTTSTTDVLSAWSTSKGEVWKCVVTPQDDESSYGNSTEKNVTILNTPPSITNATISPTTAYTGSTLTATPSGWSDIDGDTASYTYKWFKNGTEISGQTNATLSGAYFDKRDNISVGITPFDGEANGTTVYSTNITISNSKPSISAVSISPTPARKNSTLTAEPSGWIDSDNDAANYTYKWYVNSTLIVGQTNQTLTNTFFGKGSKVYIEITPFDGEEYGTTLTSTNITITNSAPTISSVVINPNTVYTTTTLSINISGWIDLDGDSPNYTYQWLKGSAVISTENTLGGEYFIKSDTISVKVTPYDGEEYGAPIQSSSVLVKNSPPVINTAFISPDPAFKSNDLTAGVSSFSDLDGDTVLATYQWYKNGTPISGATSSVLSKTYLNKMANITVKITPTDGGVESGTPFNVSIVISNSKPSVSSVSITPSTAYTSTDLTATPSTWVDDDGDSELYYYKWYKNDTIIVGQTNSTLKRGNFSKGDKISVEITPYDGSENGTTKKSSNIFIGNSKPTISSVSITPALAYKNSTLSVNISGWSDSDEDTPSYRYKWYKEGISIGATTSTLNCTYYNLRRDDLITVEVTPFDGIEYGTAITSEVLKISNSKPSATSVNILPTTAYTDSELNATASGWVDIDGDTEGYTYKWFKNGTEIVGQTNRTLPGIRFVRDDNITVEVTPYDGVDTGTAMLSSAINIVNKPPAIESIIIGPTIAYKTTNLTASISAADADDDAISFTYEWYKNDALLCTTLSTSNTSDLLNSTNFVKGDRIYVKIIPFDGFVNGSTTVSLVKNITNSKPEIKNITINPSIAFKNTTLTATPNGWSDADGDASQYKYAWYKGYEEILEENTNQLIVSLHASKGNLVRVKITPYDGEEDGTPIISSIRINNSLPSIQSIDLSSTSLGVGATLTATPMGWADKDGDPSGYNYQWYINGVPIPEAISNTLKTENFKKGDNITIQITPNDGQDLGISINQTFRIANTPPQISETPNISPTTAYIFTNLSVIVKGWYDVDGDTERYVYQWYKNDVPIQNATEKYLDCKNYFVKASDLLKVVVTPFDGESSGTSKQASIRISNSKPSIANILFTPDEIYTNTTITVIPMNWSDADGDSPNYIYRWFVGASEILTADTNVLSDSNFKKGDPIKIIITPKDGTDYGEAVTSPTIIVKDSPPIITSAVPSSTQNLSMQEGGELTLSVSILDNDVTEGTDSLTYVWYVGGAQTSSSAGPGKFVYRPDYNGSINSPHKIAVIATDTTGLNISYNWTVVVENVNAPPMIFEANPPTEGGIPPQIYTGTSKVFSITAADYFDKDNLTYYWYVDGKLLAETKDGNFSFTPSDDMTEGSHELSVVVSDGSSMINKKWALSVSRTAKPPTLFEEYAEYIVAGVTMIGMGSTGAYAYIRKRRKMAKLSEYITRIEEIYSKNRAAPKRCEELLGDIRDKVIQENIMRRIDEHEYNILERKIDDYLKRIRTYTIQEEFKGMPMDVSSTIKDILDDGVVTKDEVLKLRATLAKSKDIDEKTKERLISMVGDWSKKDTSALSTYLVRLNDVSQAIKIEPEKAESQMLLMKKQLSNDLKNGVVDPHDYLTVENKIDNGLKEARNYLVSTKFKGVSKEVAATMKNIMEDGVITKDEFSTLQTLLARTRDMDEATKNKIEKLFGGWATKEVPTVGTYLKKIDDVYNANKSSLEKCESELVTLKEELIEGIKNGVLDTQNYMLLEKRIDEHLKNVRTQTLSSKIKQMPKEVEKTIKDILEDGVITADEFTTLQSLLSKTEGMDIETRRKLEGLFGKWMIEDKEGKKSTPSSPEPKGKEQKKEDVKIQEPKSVKCSKCGSTIKVTSAQRPVGIICSNCGTKSILKE